MDRYCCTYCISNTGSVTVNPLHSTFDLPLSCMRSDSRYTAEINAEGRCCFGRTQVNPFTVITMHHHLSPNIRHTCLEQVPPNTEMPSNELAESIEKHDSIQESQTASVSKSTVSSPDRNVSFPKERSSSMCSDISTTDLQFIAAELSCLKPKKHSALDEAEFIKDDHQITLGTVPNESTGTNRSHRRPMSLVLPRVLKPLEAAPNFEAVVNKSPSKKASPSASPSRRRFSLSPEFTPDDLVESDRSFTPISKCPSGTFADDGNTVKTLEQPKNATLLEIRSSEQEPSVHQTNIPDLSQFLFPARLCYMLDLYRQVDQNFDLHCLVGVRRFEIESFLRPSHGNEKEITISPKMLETDKVDSYSPSSKRHLSHQQITSTHEPILETFLKCSKSDLVLEGFFHELVIEGRNRNGRYDSTSEKSTLDRMEVAVFSSDYNRQFIVVYQGSVDMQAKSIWNQNDQKVRGSSQESILSDEQPVTVFSPFKNAYFHESNLEQKVFAKLDELIQNHPFFDVVMAGFSFGGALASIASMRYAASNPMLLVSCFAFSCPKVGAMNHRYYVNSLPNLKVCFDVTVTFS